MAVGVMIKKKMMPNTMGLIILPRPNPNKYHALFKALKEDGVTIDIIKNKALNIKKMIDKKVFK